MVVPFLFETLYYDREYPLYSWVFYRFLSVLEKDSYLIAQENHYGKMTQDRKAYFLENSKVMGYRLPKDQELERLRRMQITNDETKEILSHYKSRYLAAQSLITKQDTTLEHILEDRLDKIEQLTKKKVDVLLVWVGLRSVYEVAKRRNISVVTMELSALRKPSYHITLGHFSYQDKYDKRGCIEDYKCFLKEIKKKSLPILSRKELLSFVLPTEKLHLLEEKDNLEQFEIGVSPGIKQDYFFDNFKKEPLDKTITTIDKLFHEQDVSIRFHPLHEWDLTFPNWEIDTSSTSYEWILKCKRIVSTVSNIGFEAMLFGKTAYVLCDYMPFSFMGISSLDVIDDTVTDVTFLNYMLFSYYVPWELLFDLDYIKWRMTNPTPLERFNYHMDYIKKKYQIKESLNLDTILKKVHHLEKEKIEYYKQVSVHTMYEKKERQLERLQVCERDNEIYKEELHLILNSTSWKVTKPFRYVISKLKRR